MSVALLLVLAASGQMKVASPEWKFTGIDPKEGGVYQSRFTTLLGERTGLRIMTASDVYDVLTLERQRQMLGCDSAESNCSAELAGALGADAVLSGTLGKAGKSFVVTLRGLNTANGEVFATATVRVGTEEELFAWLEAEARSFADRMRASFSQFVEERTRVTYRYRSWTWAVAGAGGLMAGLGLAGYLGSRSMLAAIRAREASPNEALLVQQGQLFQDGGVGLITAGGLVLATGVLLLFVTREDAKAMVSLLPTPEGAFLGVQGTW